MSKRTLPHGMLAIVALAALGAAVLWLVPELVGKYHLIAQSNRFLAMGYLVIMGVVGGGFVVALLWMIFRMWLRSRRKQAHRQRRAADPSQLTMAQRLAELEENMAAVADLRDDATLSTEQREALGPLAQRIDSKREAQSLEIVAFGTISSGKSSLLNALAGVDVFATDPRGGTTMTRNEVPWPGNDQVTLVDTPGLGEVEGSARAATSATAARDADLVLVVVDGPLRESEHELLSRLGQMEKRVILCLNKADWYGPNDRDRLLGQIRNQVQSFVTTNDVVAVRSQPTTRTRLRESSTGDQTEEEVEVLADIKPLADRLMGIVTRDGSDLLMANLLLQSRGLVDEAKERVRESLDERAKQIVDKYMWAAGGAAAVSPLPLIDLAAGSAITTKMILDLAQVYRQPVDLELATKWLSQLGKNLVAILGVAAATPAVAVGVASLLKTVPGAGTIAGGALQGVVQAIITRWIGAIFIRYFRDEMKPPEGGLAELARQEWTRVTSLSELRKVVQLAKNKWGQEK